MISAPVFLLWDESISASLGGRIKTSLDRIFSGVGSQQPFNVYLDVRCFSGDGQTLISLGSLTPYSSEIFSKISSNMSGNDISIGRLEIDEYVNGRFDAHQRSEMSRPFVIVVANRPWSTAFDSKRMVRDLFGSTAEPRLAVFDKSNQFEWTQEIVDRDEKKRIRIYPLADDESDLDRYLRDLEEWFLTKISQAPSVQGVTNTVPSLPAQGIVDKTVQQSPLVNTPQTDDATRPTIALNDTPMSSPPPAQRPVVDSQGAQERPIIKNSEPSKAVGSGLTNTPLVEPPAPKTEIHVDPPVPVREVSAPENGDRREAKEDDSQGIVRRVVGWLPIGGKNKTPASEVIGEPPSDPIPSPPVIQEPEPEPPVTDDEVANQVVETYQRAADGQIIIDKKSSLNAKPWHFPEWKALPSTGPSRDLEIEYGSVGELRVFAGSARGTKHQYYGDENQDAFFIARTADTEKKQSRFVVLVASDGVGSASYSAYGSKSLSFLVARKTASLLRDFEGSTSDVQELIRVAVKEASDATQSWTTNEVYAPEEPSNESSRDDVSATLSVVVIQADKSEFGMRNVWLACVGDSPCYSLRQGEWTLRSAVTKDGEVLEHGTQALPVSLGQDPVMETFSFELHESELLMLVSDGIGTSMASGNTVVGRWMAQRLYSSDQEKLLQQLSPSELISTLTFDRQGEDDDRTMMVLFDFDGFVNSTTNVKPDVSSASSITDVPGAP
jgi:serine/threonine protein phosphatase PrpC